MEVTDPESHGLDFTLRLACWAGVVAAVVAYAVLIPMKVRGLLSPEMTWGRVIISPALLGAFAPSLVRCEMLPRRQRHLMLVALLIVLVGGGSLTMFLVDSLLR